MCKFGEITCRGAKLGGCSRYRYCSYERDSWGIIEFIDFN